MVKKNLKRKVGTVQEIIQFARDYTFSKKKNM